jgi:hypothetical protein
MVCHRRDLLLICLLMISLCLTVQPATAGSGFWDEEIKNTTGVCRYRTFFTLPDVIVTNSSQLVEVTFKVLQIAGTTSFVKTQNVEMRIDSNGKSRTFAIANEVRELNTNDTWGPIQYHFIVLDKDFDLKPQEALTAIITITVNFNEKGLGAEWGHSTKKADISAELKSSTVQTSIDYLGQILSLIMPYVIPITIGLVVVVAISVTFVFKIRVGGRRG